MKPLDDRPQIGMFTAEAGTLEEDGVTLDAIVAELGVEETGDLDEDLPRSGWRVLVLNRGTVSAIGAPVDQAAQQWRIGQILRSPDSTSTPRLSVHPASFPRRPSKRDRAGSLALRWPEVTRSAPSLDLLPIDVVNTGSERWHPQGDSFMVYAALRRPGGPPRSVSFGYVAGSAPAMPLDPGEYARVPAQIDSTQWSDLEPGTHELHAVLVELGMTGDTPLGIEITAQHIEQHSPRRRAG